MAPLRAALARHVVGLPSAFWWLWTGAFISALATFVFPFLALFLTARGYSPARAGLVVSLYGAGIMVAGPIAGMASDRFGRRPTILSALTGAAATSADRMVGRRPNRSAEMPASGPATTIPAP